MLHPDDAAVRKNILIGEKDMRNDYYLNAFKELWKETSDTVMYRIITETDKELFVRRDKIARIISDEIVMKRWRPLKSHPAKKYIDELKAADPDTGNSLENRIVNFKLDAGINFVDLLIGGIMAAAGILLIIFTSDLVKIIGAVVTALALSATVLALSRGRNVKKRAEKQLKDFGSECEKIINGSRDI